MYFTPNPRRRFLIGYSSWLNEEVRNELFPSAGLVKLIIIRGYKRVFKLERIADSGRTRLGDNILTLEKAFGEEINGILFDVSEADYNKILEQAKSYTPFFKSCYNFKTGKHVVGCGDIFIGYTKYCNKNTKPNEQHLELCREGAYSFGRVFGQMFDETVYFTNGLTLAEYYKIPKD